MGKEGGCGKKVETDRPWECGEGVEKNPFSNWFYVEIVLIIIVKALLFHHKYLLKTTNFYVWDSSDVHVYVQTLCTCRTITYM